MATAPLPSEVVNDSEPTVKAPPISDELKQQWNEYGIRLNCVVWKNKSEMSKAGKKLKHRHNEIVYNIYKKVEHKDTNKNSNKKQASMPQMLQIIVYNQNSVLPIIVYNVLKIYKILYIHNKIT